MHVATIVARNYLAYAEVLMASVARHEPGAQRTVLVTDAHPGDDLGTDVDVITPDELTSIDRDELDRLRSMYDVLEFATAIKPFLLRHLLDHGATTAVHLDPDIVVYGPLLGLEAATAGHDVVLTPHLLTPLPYDGLGIDELTILRAGAFNLGFAAVGRRARPFLDYWAERLRRWAIVAPEEGLFTDQRWVDMAPALFDVHAVRHPGWNVAYWNLHERTLGRLPDGRLTAAGEPLVFFHFSGHDPVDGVLLSRHQGHRPRHLLSADPLVAALCRTWREALHARGHASRMVQPYGLDQTPRFAVTPELRRLYREAVMRAEMAGDPPPPAPLAADGGAAFARWCHEPHPLASGSGSDVVVSRLLHALWQRRADLHGAFPHVPGRNARDLVWWGVHDVDVRGRIDPSLLPDGTALLVDRARRAAAPDRPRPGVNVVGYLDSELGVGESGRLVVLAAERAGLPVATEVETGTTSRRQHRFTRRGQGDLPYDTTLLAVNADRLPAVVDRLGPALDGRRRLGLWHWEVDVVPDDMRHAAEHLDEVWAASTYVQQILERGLDRPVLRFPLPVVRPSAPSRVTRADLGWPDDRFVVLFAFDFLSVPARKNPTGLIDAYTQAFGPHDGALLVLKSVNGHLRIGDLERVRHAAAGRADIVVHDGYVPASNLVALSERCDVYASLHRAEGFGLTMAAAMAAGTPVVATGWSGNLDFMDESCAALVPYELIPVGPSAAPYAPGATWAEPDVGAAAAALRRLFDDRAFASALGAAGRRRVRERHGLEPAAAFLRARFAARVVAA